MTTRVDVATLLATWQRAPVAPERDYQLIQRIGRRTYVARTREGTPAIVLAVEVPTVAVGRASRGFELLVHRSLGFSFGGVEWTEHGAALVCGEDQLLPTFAVLAADAIERFSDALSWRELLAWVDDWQSLFAREPQRSVEQECGLWGELWFLASATDIDTLLMGWRGPEGDVVDFSVSGSTVEVKTSKVRGTHHVSLRQVERPAGVHDAWLLSIWIRADPSGRSIHDLADQIMERCADPPDTLKRLARAGVHSSRPTESPNTFILLGEPEWYSADTVPRVREVDAGVSQIRYVVTLSESSRADSEQSSALWRRFHGHDYAQ